jgi:hypothetical protein
MDAHQHKMTTSVKSHEGNLRTLFAAANGDTTDPDALDSLGVDVDDPEESARDAINSYALEATTKTVLTVTLAIGGPTQQLSATVERGKYGWMLATTVVFFDSWAVPSEVQLPDDSPLVQLFIEHLDTLDV